MLNTVIFDIGGVLLDWAPERAFEQVMDADEVPAFMERIGFHEWNRANDARASIAEAEDALVRRFPSDEAAIRGYRQHFLHSVTGMVPGTAAVIAELGRDGVAMGALTNWAAETFALARPQFGVLNRFRDIVVSGEEGVIKPDPQIYLSACRRLGVDPGQVVFVDDSATNVAAAEELGLTGVRFSSAEQLRADLVGLGLLGPRVPVTEPVFHWALGTDWDAALASGEYGWSTRGTAYDEAGFVHCSFAAQVDGIRRELYGDLPDADLVLLQLDPADLPIVVEDGYPHLFAPLPVDRARAVDRAS